jgi:hypothetical protein
LEAQTSNKLVQKLMAVGQMSDDDERSLLHLIEAIEAKNKLKEIAAGVS